jgi:hypothetical protein
VTGKLKRESDARRDAAAELEERQREFARKQEEEARRSTSPDPMRPDPYGRHIPERFVPRPAEQREAPEWDIFSGEKLSRRR